MTLSQKNLELLKHRHALELETLKWDYRQLELQYLEAGQHLRSLNQLMWQVPGMAIAITGGIWYGAATVESNLARVWVFSFVAIIDFLTVLVLLRLRERIQIHINRQADFAGQSEKEDPRRGTVVACWAAALLTAAFVSVIGATHPEELEKKRAGQANTKHTLATDVQPQQCAFVTSQVSGSSIKDTTKLKKSCNP